MILENKIPIFPGGAGKALRTRPAPPARRAAPVLFCAPFLDSRLTPFLT
jgi:hypothetical protein